MKCIVALGVIGLLAMSDVARAQSPSDEVVRLEAQVSTLRLTYTEMHPAVRAVIARLEELKEADKQSARNELARLRLTYTEQHPLVQAQLAKIRTLEPK